MGNSYELHFERTRDARPVHIEGNLQGTSTERECAGEGEGSRFPHKATLLYREKLGWKIGQDLWSSGSSLPSSDWNESCRGVWDSGQHSGHALTQAASLSEPPASENKSGQHMNY